MHCRFVVTFRRVSGRMISVWEIGRSQSRFIEAHGFSFAADSTGSTVCALSASTSITTGGEREQSGTFMVLVPCLIVFASHSPSSQASQLRIVKRRIKRDRKLVSLIHHRQTSA